MCESMREEEMERERVGGEGGRSEGEGERVKERGK